MNASVPLVSVVIVNYNGRHLLGDCLSAVCAQVYPSFEVILVDNGSSDESVPFVQSAFPTVNVFRAETNLGFAGGNNLGVAQARGDLILLLNNDTVVQPDWLRALVEAAAAPDVAVVSSLVLTGGIPPRYYERNGSINFLCHNIMRVFERPENIFYGGGASVLFKKDLLGVPFDDEYFAYAEDVYLGLRARFMGYRVLHSNASVVHHLGGVTAKKQKNDLVTYLQERNRILTILLFFSGFTLLRVAPLLFLNATAKLLRSIFSSRHSFRGTLRAYAWLLMHIPLVRSKRGVLFRERTSTDREVISWMTGKLTNGESLSGRFVNAVALGYCRVVGLTTIEFFPAGTR